MMHSDPPIKVIVYWLALVAAVGTLMVIGAWTTGRWIVAAF